LISAKSLFSELLERYLLEVTARCRSKREDTFRLRALQRRWIAQLSLEELTPEKLRRYRNERLAVVSAGTVLRELAYFSSVINHARSEWDLEIDNPVRAIRKPMPPPGRSRLLTEIELQRLLKSAEPCIKSSNPYWPYIIRFALESAMRRGEILGLRWSVVNLDARTIHLSQTKNGSSRVVPLSTGAVNVLREVPRDGSDRVFPVTGYALSAAFERFRRRAGIEDFHFHDLRHMAITRLSERLPNVIELAAVSGHRSLKMLHRYYHPSAKQLVEKLR